MTIEPKIPSPENHHWVKTEDGSWSIFSHLFQEAAHSNHGAIAETKLRFIQGCQLYQRANIQSKEYKIFEVGFGLGIGALESFALWFKQYQHLKVEFISCEIDENLILWCKNHLSEIMSNTYPEEVWSLLKNLQLDPTAQFYQSHFEHRFFIKIFRGDILSHQNYLLENYSSKIDSIFQDAYSPKKNPTLWTLDWFVFVKKLTYAKTILSTYSSSTSVRLNLNLAGFIVVNGPGFGKKKSSTLAYLENITPLGNSDEKK